MVQSRYQPRAIRGFLSPLLATVPRIAKISAAFIATLQLAAESFPNLTIPCLSQRGTLAHLLRFVVRACAEGVHVTLPKEIAIASKITLREWFSIAFTRVEDAIYVGLAFLLAAVAGSLLIAEIVFFAQYLLAGILSENIVMLLDRILLIIIFVEVLYTVQVSFRQHVLQPGPFLVVGLIAVTRRILVLTAELPKLVKESGSVFHNAMIELGLLTVLIVALVVSLHILRPGDPNSAAEDTPKKK